MLWAALSCLVLGIALVFAARHVRDAVRAPLDAGDAPYVVAPGQTLGGFARELKRRGVIDETYSLRAYAWWTDQARRIKAGQYRFGDAQSLAEILERLVAGDVATYRIRFIEGWTFAAMREELARHAELRAETTGLDDAQVMALLGAPDRNPEGLFFPDTYRFPSGTRDVDVLRQAYRLMQRVLREEWENRAAGLPLQSPYDALILASIVEKETGKAEERATIAGVLVNRLGRNMRLQVDPTVIYGLGDRYRGNLKREHLKQDTPYNTYTRRGLPPTPIAMPGRAAIRAAVRPAPTKALYFVARGDGSHQFSESIEEHNRAVRKFQLKRKSG